MIDFLEWDSRFFGMKTGKITAITIDATDITNIITQKEKDCYELLYLFCDDITPEAERIIVTYGGLLADTKTTYQKQITPFEKKEPSPEIATYNGPLSDELLQLAIDSGHKSRFAFDGRLAPFFPELYKQWIEKSLTGQLADLVLVYWFNNHIAGFVTAKIRNKHGQIGLIAVAPHVRGMGIGKQLLEAIHDWYYQQQVTSCSVVTQLQNAEACRLYEKAGYTIQSMQKIYHI